MKNLKFYHESSQLISSNDISLSLNDSYSTIEYMDYNPVLMDDSIVKERRNDVIIESCADMIMVDRHDRPLCGTLWYLAFVLLSPLDIIFSKILFDRITTLGAFQITFFRSLIVLAVIGIYLNFNLKSETYTKLKGVPKKALIFRDVQSGAAAIINTAVAKVISLTMIAVIKSLIPTFVVIIAWLFIGEKLKIFELGIMVMTISGIIVILVNRKKKA